MSRWKLVLEYEGTNFHGWQRQPSGRTVEEVLESALSRFCQSEVDVIGQGRTDSGVHAEGQVAHVDLPAGIEHERLVGAMSGLLPDDLSVTHVERIDDSFHARFDARSRTYRYQILKRNHPLRRGTCWFVPDSLNEGLLQECATLLIGEHNFMNFSKLDEDSRDAVCRISRSEWQRSGDLLSFNIQGNRFLRHMVRRLVGTMVQVASGRVPPEHFKSLLFGNEVRQKGFSAPARGLILESVCYHESLNA